MNWRNYFRAMWPNKYRAVMAQYAALKTNAPLVYADIALRGGVYSVPHPPVSDPFQAGVNEGRRQMAIETIKLANEDFDALLRLIERPTTRGDT